MSRGVWIRFILVLGLLAGCAALAINVKPNLGLEDELCAAPEVQAQVGLDVESERRATGQEAEDEDEADPDTT